MCVCLSSGSGRGWGRGRGRGRRGSFGSPSKGGSKFKASYSAEVEENVDKLFKKKYV